MSLALTVIKQGTGEGFINRWLTGFGISFAVAVSISWFAVPRIQKFFDQITENPDTAIAEGSAAAAIGTLSNVRREIFSPKKFRCF